MAGKKGRSGAPGQTRLAGPGRPPKSATLRLGDGIGLRVGAGTMLQIGEVVEIKRGIPRTVVIDLRNGERVWLLAETPKKEGINDA